MLTWFDSTILGLVQGITEFLPISSTGHMVISSALLGLDSEAPFLKTFEIVVQLGSILAVLLLYRDRFIGLIPKRRNTRTGGSEFSGWRGLWLLFLTCLPASLVGLAFHSAIKKYLFTPPTVALALAVGGVLMLLVEWRKPRARIRTLDEVTPRMAIGVGLCQCLSLWPGFSRSASTIMGGMVCGADRKTAANYAFMAAVPIMFAATALELYKNLGSLHSDLLPVLGVGLLMAFISAWVAIKVFIRLVSRVSLRPFAIYRLALAPLVYWLF